MKEKAKQIDHIVDCPTGKPGVILRIERRHWEDGTSCLHIAKYATRQGKRGPYLSFYRPAQYIQIDWERRNHLTALLATLSDDVPAEMAQRIRRQVGGVA